MSYDVHGEGGMAARWHALPTGWKVVIGAAALLFVASAMGEDGGGDAVPPAVHRGVRLAGVQLQGEKPMYHADGIEVLDVDGEWAEVRFGDDDKTRRWIHFAYVAGFQVRED